MKIAIIGTGHVGGTLGRLWASHKHTIYFGSRDPLSTNAQALQGENIQIGTISGAVAFGDVLVLATPWPATLDVVRQLGDVSGKIIIDTTNPLLPGLAGLSIGLTTSAAEEIARLTPKAKVVKAFNMIGAGRLPNPVINGQHADIFICGDDTAAKETVGSLVQLLGFGVVDAGGLQQARLLEPLALLWISLAFKQGLGTDIAFKLLAN